MAKKRKFVISAEAQQNSAVVEVEPVELVSGVIDVEAQQEVEEDVYMPPQVRLEDMTKEQIAAVSMRYFGVRPDAGALKDEQVAEVRRRMRAGRPAYA